MQYVHAVSAFLRSIGALYVHDYARRLKTCRNCRTQFSDITKRNLRNTCNDTCDSACVVSSRRARGNYAQTEEQRRRKSVSVRATYASRDVFTLEQKQRFSETMKRTWEEGKIDTSLHWSKTPEGKERLREMHLGRKHSDAVRQHMSLGAQKRLRTKRETMHTSANGGFREDLGAYFRSGWEANFACILNLQNKQWSYEPKTFQLDTSLSYTPDFYIEDENAFYEIKGRWTDKARLQLDLMEKLFPEIVVRVIDSARYTQLKVEYQDKVLWEGK